MISGLLVLVAVIMIVQVIIGLSFVVSSISERENRAIFFGSTQLVLMLTVLIGYLSLALRGFFFTPAGEILLLAMTAAIFGALIILFRKETNQRALAGSDGYVVGKVERFDERDLVFARNRAMRPGTKEYEAYYQMHPERETADKIRRAKGGVTGAVGKIDSPDSGFQVAMAAACLSIPHHLSHPSIVKPTPHPVAKHFVKFDKPFDEMEATRRVKGFTRKLGADLVGIAKINPHWVYSNRGEIFNENWEDWGKPIELNHKYAIVFAEEMDFGLTMSAPHTPTLIESMRNYGKGAYISSQLAAFIANLCFSATANHLRHYELILPAIAVDAGLGELSRMGYLMTKEFGPRIRLSAVTTDLPLIADKPVDLGIQSFCEVCKKCAHTCPSQSISDSDKTEESNGSLRWRIDAESCFEYWAKVGTDCNICMRVCPWSHERTWPHKLITYLTTRNRINQRIFSVLDDLFYGRKPRAKKQKEDWASLT